MNENIIGQEIEAFCGKCKTDTIHLITSVEGGKISKLMCKTCMSYHRYRKPTGKDKILETVAAAAKPATKAPTRRARRDKWTRLLDTVEAEKAIEYKMDESYDVETAIHHKTFGLGIVKNVINSRKMAVLFHDGEKILIQNHTF